MHIIIAGGCGFIGSNFVKMVVAKRPAWRVTVVDALTYAGNLANLADTGLDLAHAFAKGNISDNGFVERLFGGFPEPPECVVNFAAESHVDRSILGPRAFIETNILGAFNLLERVRLAGRGRFVQISTDEVYGSLGDEGKFTELTPLDPSSPYSASKASADLLVQAHHRTFGVDTVITRCSNNYGPYQFPEKLIPLMTINAMQGKELPVYGAGRNVRDWIHAEDHCRGILMAIERGRSGEVYNFGGESEMANIQIVERIADAVTGGRDLIRFVKDRPGHDWRYAMDITKVRDEMGWSPAVTFDDGLRATVEWYKEHRNWWQPILTGEYLTFYDQWYNNR
ncbi:MAG: dTDP-glucose 4,6-dehydratase [Deltaproteobacteria bacterium]|nr:dTDP-glucose 4,6-dehydratase [Deltaproteobacteria bacterium]